MILISNRKDAIPSLRPVKALATSRSSMENAVGVLAFCSGLLMILSKSIGLDLSLALFTGSGRRADGHCSYGGALEFSAGRSASIPSDYEQQGEVRAFRLAVVQYDMWWPLQRDRVGTQSTGPISNP